MFSKKYTSSICSVLWVMVFAFSLVQPAYAAPVKEVQAAAAPEMLQFTSGGHVLGFSSGGLLAATGDHALRVEFVDANGVQPQSDTPANPKGQAAALGQVTYANLWKGINLDFAATGGSIYSTTYQVAAGANPADIRLHYNTPLTLNGDGTLGINYKTGTLTESAPLAWQDIDGRRVTVPVSFRVEGQEVGFKLGAYNPAYTLTIDPSLTWNTFLGGTGNDIGYGIAVDDSGNIYVDGYSAANWGVPMRVYSGGDDAFVAKLNSSGVLQWNTFLGSSGVDRSSGIAVDGSGNVFVVGTSSATWGTPMRAFSGGVYDAFVAKLSPSGVLSWSTFLGSNGSDGGGAIALDGSGYIDVTGYSDTTWGIPVHTFSGAADAFAARLTSTGALAWNTFLGGSGSDFGKGIAVDGSGNIYVSGDSNATWGAAPLRAYSNGYDAFVAKLTSSGALTWNTFLGGTGNDNNNGGGAAAVDSSGNVVIVGTSTVNWGTPVRGYSGTANAFAAKLSPSGDLTWNTFLGGGMDEGNGIAIDKNDNVLLTGYSYYSWGTPQRAHSSYNNNDAFVAKLSSSGGLQTNTFIGGDGDDVGYGIAVDDIGSMYVTGYSNYTWGLPLQIYSNLRDAFAAKVDFTPPTVVSILRAGTNPSHAASVDYTVTFSEPVLGVDPSDFGLMISNPGQKGASIGSVIKSDLLGTTYTVSVNTNAADGTLRLELYDNDTIIDAAGNPLGGAGLGNGDFTTGETFTIDWTAPLVLSIERASLNPSGADGVVYTVTFSEPVTGLNAADFSLTTTGVTGASITNVSGSEAAYTVQVNTGSGSGTLRLNVIDDDSIIDAAGNPLGGPGAGNGNFTTGETFTIDRTAPVVSSSVHASPNPTRAASVNYTVTFSEPVTGVDKTDFTLTPIGVTGAIVSSASGSGAVYNVVVNTGSGSGSLRLNLIDTDSIIDATGNPLGGPGAGNGNFTTGETYTIDRTAPLVSSSVRTSANPSRAASVNFTVTFDETVTGVDTSDFTLTTTGVTGASVSGVSGSGATYIVAVSTGSGNGSLRLNVIDNDSIVDMAGNPLGGTGTGNGSFTGGDSYTIDKTAPLVSSSVRANATPSSETSVNYTVTFSEAVTGVDKTDFSLTTTGVTGATVSSVSGSGTTYSVAVATGSGDGTTRLNVIDNDSIVDVAGNPLGGMGSGNGAFSSGETYTITKTAPGAATLVSPLASVTTDKPTFVWSKVAAATLYRLWIKNSSDTWVVQNLYSGTNICGATNCGVTITTPLVNGTYTWNIQTLTATQNGAWSGHSFTVAIPTPGVSTLVSPKGTIHLAKPTFIWSKDSVATLYRLWVKDSGGTWVFQNLYAGTNICGVTNCAMVSPVSLANGSYTWYIQTLTNTQNGQWSAQAFVVSVPDEVPAVSDGDGSVK